MKITVVICTYNRADLLLRTIDSINRAERPEGADLSILVVANACTDATTDRLDAYRQHIKNANGLPLRYLEEKTPGKSHALNRAIHEIDDGYICFIDDDHRLDRGYLLAVVEAIEKHPEITLFCGRVIPDWQGDEPQWLHEKGKYRLYPSPVPNFDLGREVRHLSAETPLPGGGQSHRGAWRLPADGGVFHPFRSPGGEPVRKRRQRFRAARPEQRREDAVSARDTPISLCGPSETDDGLSAGEEFPEKPLHDPGVQPGAFVGSCLPVEETAPVRPSRHQLFRSRRCSFLCDALRFNTGRNGRPSAGGRVTHTRKADDPTPWNIDTHHESA